MAIFCFGKRHPYQNKFCEKGDPIPKQISDTPNTLSVYGMARGALGFREKSIALLWVESDRGQVHWVKKGRVLWTSPFLARRAAARK